MGYSAKAIANAILQIARSRDESMSPLKLQKMVYISHGWNLAINNEPLVSDEFAEAWQYGPVFPSLYHEFKGFGNGNITTKARELEVIDESDLSFSLIEPVVSDDDKDTWKLLETVWDKYGQYNGLTLSDVTHQPNTPWQKVWQESGGRKNADISNELIADHYKNLSKKNQNDGAQ